VPKYAVEFKHKKLGHTFWAIVVTDDEKQAIEVATKQALGQDVDVAEYELSAKEA
jgi:hypothetical protein